MDETLKNVVLDCGSANTRAGFAGDDFPFKVFPSAVARQLKSPRGALWGEITSNSLESEGLPHFPLTTEYPIKHGVVENWDAVEELWIRAFAEIGAEPSERKVLHSSPLLTEMHDRRRTVEITLETLECPATYMESSAILPLYATGRTTGIVFSAGDGLMSSYCVYEGYGFAKSARRTNMAGRDITLALAKQLRRSGALSGATTADFALARDIKERCCYISLNPSGETQEGDSLLEYKLPDGKLLKLGGEAFEAPEALFDPSRVGLAGCLGAHKLVQESIQSCDVDTRRDLFANIVIEGGTTFMSKFNSRLESEIKGLVPRGIGIKIKVIASSKRQHAVWVGGSMLTSLSTFQPLWITRESYLEFGESCVAAETCYT